MTVDGASDPDRDRVPDAAVAVAVKSVLALAAESVAGVLACCRRMALKATASSASSSLSGFLLMCDIVGLFDAFAFLQLSHAIQPATRLAVVRCFRQVSNPVSSRSLQAGVATVGRDEASASSNVGQTRLAGLCLHPLDAALRVQKLDERLVVAGNHGDLESVELVRAFATFAFPLRYSGPCDDENRFGTEILRIGISSANDVRSAGQQACFC